MEEKLIRLKNEALAIIYQTDSLKELERLRIRYLGKKGSLTILVKNLPKLSSDKRKAIGKLVNSVKGAIEQALKETQRKILEKRGKDLEEKEWIDVTRPGIKPTLGHLHPITFAIREIAPIFERIGFQRVRPPEIEKDWYAFEGLNMPPNHPARDEWETFFIDHPSKKLVLTPHTTSGDLHLIEKKNLPIRAIFIGKCYRRQVDVSHTPMFHQFDGLLLDENVTVSHLKGVLDYFVRQFFGPKRRSRIRPFHFRFTEPSFEVDVTCDVCQGKGCRLCKEGWLELGGAGMLHPSVLKNGGIDPKKYKALAFGWGVERTYMMKEGLKIDDIRILYSNDLRFLKQF